LSLSVSNSGINTATNILVTNVIPVGFVFLNATSSAGTVTHTNGAVIWTIATRSNGFLRQAKVWTPTDLVRKMWYYVD
jgi:uncharacterized repeat protein (TIGR01451 family)